MNIQIFGKKKCFDTKKAERWFKERRIKFQQIDLVRFGLSGGEFDSVLRAVGGVDALIDWSAKSPEIDLMRYTDDKRAKEDKLFDHPELEAVCRSLTDYCAPRNIALSLRQLRAEPGAVRLAQQRAGLQVTGTVDRETWAALQAQSCPHCNKEE